MTSAFRCSIAERMRKLSIAFRRCCGFISTRSPWITRFPGTRWAIGKVVGEAADTVATRILEAGISQGALNTVTDPGAQAGGIVAGMQPEGYDPARTALAFPAGLVVGGAA
jgi:hypothetical protein